MRHPSDITSSAPFTGSQSRTATLEDLEPIWSDHFHKEVTPSYLDQVRQQFDKAPSHQRIKYLDKYRTSLSLFKERRLDESVFGRGDDFVFGKLPTKALPIKEAATKAPYIPSKTSAGYGKVLKYAGVVAAAMYLSSSLATSDDDKHLVTDAFRHEGFSKATRWRYTDFGSGYQGPNPWLNPTYNRAEDVERYKWMRGSKLGASEAELYKYFTKKENPPEWLSATASAGTALHLLESAKAVKEGEIEAAEELVYDPETRITGHIDITHKSGAPADIKTVSSRRFSQLQEEGAFPEHVHQLNWYMHMKGASHGYLEYINRQNLSQRKTLRINYSQQMYEKDIMKLMRVRRRVEQEIEAGILDANLLPKTASVERLKKAEIEEKNQTQEFTKKIPYLETVYQQEMDYLERVKKDQNQYGDLHNAYDMLEGLRHGNFAEHIRRFFSDFGSGSQIAKRMVKGLVPNTMEKAKNSFFKTLLGKSTIKEIKEQLPELYEQFGIKKISEKEFLSDPALTSKYAELASSLTSSKPTSPMAMVEEGLVFTGTKNFEKDYVKALKLTRQEKEALPVFAETHELLEVLHGRNTWESVGRPSLGTKQHLLSMKPKFGTHMSQRVIRDETYLAKELGGPFESLQRKLRSAEGVHLEKSVEQLKQEAIDKVQQSRRARTAYRKKEISKEEALRLYYGGKEDHYKAKTAILMKEGIHPGTSDSLSAGKIREHSDFGSGWDKVRAMAKAMFRHLPDDEAYNKFTKSDIFKESLEKGLQGKGRVLGEGAMGKVTEYSTRVPHGIEGLPEEFSFVVKEGKSGGMIKKHLRGLWRSMSEEYRADMLKNKSKWKEISEQEQRKMNGVFEAFETSSVLTEKEALEKVGHLNAPSLYAHGPDIGGDFNKLIMEKIEGQPLSKFGGLTEAESRELYTNIKSMHKQGVTHADLHHENILKTADDKLAVIDFGLSNRLENPFLNKSVWTRQESEIQEAAQKILGREISARELEETADIGRVYSHMLTQKGYDSNAMHTAMNNLITSGSADEALDASKDLLQTGKYAENFFNNGIINMELSSLRSVGLGKKAGVETVKTQVQNAVSAEQTSQPTKNLNVTVSPEQRKETVRRVKKFRRLATTAHGAGARAHHNAIKHGKYSTIA